MYVGAVNSDRGLAWLHFYNTHNLTYAGLNMLRMLNPSLAAESNCYCYIKQIRQVVKDLVILLRTFLKILVYAHVLQ